MQFTDAAAVIPLWTIEKFGGLQGQVITKQINTWIEHGGLMMVFKCFLLVDKSFYLGRECLL